MNNRISPYRDPAFDRVHLLKISPEFLGDLRTGQKTFEVRKNDRDFQIDDVLLLAEWNEERSQFSDYNYEARVITYILPGGQFGIEPSYCVLGLEVAYVYTGRLKEWFEREMMKPVNYQ